MPQRQRSTRSRTPLRTRNINGYDEYFDKKRGTWVRTHRRVAEKNFGAANIIDKHIHHIDEDKTNNRPSNLVALTPAMHARVHQAPDACFRCGNTGHWVEDCYATRDYLGRLLPPRR